MSAAREGWRRLLAVAAAVLVADQALKALVVSLLERGERVDLMLGLEIANVRNRGVAFGMLSEGNETALTALTVAALALLVAHFARHASRRLLWLGTGLTAGGALGNLADRIRLDAVVDFLDPPAWPAFNLADVAIVVGVVTLILAIGAEDG